MATIMKPVLEGLAYLHASVPPILHRDIKACPAANQQQVLAVMHALCSLTIGV